MDTMMILALYLGRRPRESCVRAYVRCIDLENYCVFQTARGSPNWSLRCTHRQQYYDMERRYIWVSQKSDINIFGYFFHCLVQ